MAPEDLTMSRAPVTPLPRLARIADGLVAALVLLSAFIAATGGGRLRYAGLQLSLTDPVRPLAVAAIIVVLRHWLVRTPTIVERFRRWLKAPPGQVPTDSKLLTVGFLAGLVLRLLMLAQMGTTDMLEYRDWAQRAWESGLPQTYHGIYFPLQYQIFMVCDWLAATLAVNWVPVFKFANLLFDACAFVLVAHLLRRQGSRPAYALLYWLHPWFLSVFSLGYIDFQFMFFVLLCVACLRGERTKDYLLAGVPLGAAFLMKPQAQVLMVVSFAYGMFRLARARDPRPLAILAFPIVLFLAYEAYFASVLVAERGARAAALLPESYLGVVNVMPALTAQMPNLWYPIAYLLKQPGDQIYAVSDQLRPLLGVPLKYAAAVVVLGLVIFHVSRVARRSSATVAERFLSMFGFATVIIPFLMTSAHENHLFLGSVFLVLFLAKSMSPAFRWAAHALLAIQFLNIYGLYGNYPVWVGELLRGTYSQRLALVYALVSVPCFVWVLRELGRKPNTSSSSGCVP